MKRTSLITDFICYLIVFIFVFSVGAYIIASEIIYNRELLELDNSRNIEASKYAKDFSSKQQEIVDLSHRKKELLESLTSLKALTENKIKDEENQETTISTINAEIAALGRTIEKQASDLSSINNKVKELNNIYLSKNDEYIKILKEKTN